MTVLSKELHQGILDMLILSMISTTPDEWDKSPTMVVDIKVPYCVREILREVPLNMNKTIGEFESELFSTLVILGLKQTAIEMLENKDKVMEIIKNMQEVTKSENNKV